MSLDVQTNAASNVTHNSATLSGTIYHDLMYNVWFIIQKAGTGYWSQVDAGQSDFHFSAGASGLDPDTDYEFAAYAEGYGDSGNGETLSFRTGSAPYVPVQTPQAVSGGLGLSGSLGVSHSHTPVNTNIPVSGTIKLNGALGVETYKSKLIDGALSLEGNLQITTHRTQDIGGNLGLDGSLGIEKLANHIELDGGITLSGELDATKAAHKQSTSGALGLSGELSISRGKALSGSLGLEGDLTAGKVHNVYIKDDLGGGITLSAELDVGGEEYAQSASGELTLTGRLDVARVFITGAELLLADLLGDLEIMLNELNQADGEPFEYPPAVGLMLLNHSKDKVMAGIHHSYFTKYHIMQAAVPLDANGSFCWDTALTRDVYAAPKGIMGLHVNSDKWARLISFEEHVQNKRTQYFEYSESDRVVYIRGNNMYFEPFTVGDTVDVYYMRRPVEMALNITGNTDDDTNCDLPMELKNLLLWIAAGEGYFYGNDLKRSDRCELKIKELFEKAEERNKISGSTSSAYRQQLAQNPFAKGSRLNIWTNGR